IGDGLEVDLAAIFEHAARDADAIAAAENAHRQLGTAGAHEAGKADDFASAQVEVGPRDHHPPVLGRAVHGPVLDAQDLPADVRLVLGKAVLQIATHHAGDDAVLGYAVATHVERLDGLPVAQDRC